MFALGLDTYSKETNVTFLETAQGIFSTENVDVDKCSAFLIDLLPTIHGDSYDDMPDMHMQIFARIISNIINRSRDDRL